MFKNKLSQFKQKQKKRRAFADSSDKKKDLVLAATVVFFMVLIFSLWVFNFKNNVLGVASVERGNEKEDNLSQEFEEIIEETRKEFSEFEDHIKNATSSAETKPNEKNSQDVLNNLSDNLSKEASTSADAN